MSLITDNFKQPSASLYFNQANIYIKGGEGFCSIATEGQLALIGKVNIPPDDAKSVAVPIVPKRTGEVEVEVASVFRSEWQNTADSVRRRLFVVVSEIFGDTPSDLFAPRKSIFPFNVVNPWIIRT